MKLIAIYMTAGMLEAEMVKAFLEAQGFDVILSQESIAQTMGLSAGKLGEVKVLVPSEQEEEARDVLEAMQRGDFEDPGTQEQAPEA